MVNLKEAAVCLSHYIPVPAWALSKGCSLLSLLTEECFPPGWCFKEEETLTELLWGCGEGEATPSLLLSP